MTNGGAFHLGTSRFWQHWLLTLSVFDWPMPPQTSLSQSFVLNRNSPTTGEPLLRDIWGVFTYFYVYFRRSSHAMFFLCSLSKSPNLPPKMRSMSGLISKEELHAIQEQQSPLAAQDPPEISQYLDVKKETPVT